MVSMLETVELGKRRDDPPGLIVGPRPTVVGLVKTSFDPFVTMSRDTLLDWLGHAPDLVPSARSRYVGALATTIFRGQVETLSGPPVDVNLATTSPRQISPALLAAIMTERRERLLALEAQHATSGGRERWLPAGSLANLALRMHTAFDRSSVKLQAQGPVEQALLASDLSTTEWPTTLDAFVALDGPAVTGILDEWASTASEHAVDLKAVTDIVEAIVTPQVAQELQAQQAALVQLGTAI